MSTWEAVQNFMEERHENRDLGATENIRIGESGYVYADRRNQPFQLNEDQRDEYGLPEMITAGGGLDEPMDTSDTLAAGPEPTWRESVRYDTLEFLQERFGWDTQTARDFSEILWGSTGELSSTAFGIGLADLLPITAAPLTMQEGAQQFSQGMETGSGTDMAIGGFLTAAGALESIPVFGVGFKMLNKAAQSEVVKEFITVAGDAFNRTGELTQDALIEAGQAAQARLDSMMSGFGYGSRWSQLTPEENIAALDKAQAEIADAADVATRRVGTTGQYVGAPRGINSPQKLSGLRRKIKALVKEGEPGRFWYERSGQQILEAVGGDIDEADKVIQAIAVTSPGTRVKLNFDFALQAYSQWKAGKPIKTGRFPTSMSKKLEEIFSGKDWAGRKTDDFYNNLMIHIDPERAGPVTGDIWMLRAFGFTKANEMPSPQQYAFMTKETQKIANELGWEPHQVQAAIWVNMKARSENVGVKALTEKTSEAKGWITYKTNKKGKKERVVLDKEKHLANWFKHAMRHTPTAEDIEKAKFDYADAIGENLAQVSWESIPGRTGNHMPEMFNAPYEQQAEYHVAISKAFLDDDGNDIIAKELGILSPGDFEAPGFFEGKVSPGTQTEMVMPQMYKGPPTKKLEPAATDLINAYSAARGILMKQDGVGWHRPFYNAKAADSNGIDIRIGRNLSEDETTRLWALIKKEAGHGGYNPISSRQGARIINFDHLQKVPDGKGGFKPLVPEALKKNGGWVDENHLVTNKEFHAILKRALDRMKFDGDITYQAKRFASQNGYLRNDWGATKHGEGYLESSLKGRSDIQRKVRSIVSEIQERIDDIDIDFSERYGWTRNDELNNRYRSGSEVTPPVAAPGNPSTATPGELATLAAAAAAAGTVYSQTNSAEGGE